ncbi:MAG: hypothetical protein J5777_05090 [Clostridiales bacterium]|nr:hypothetical protein [Clostridiales bacterium]
MEKVTAFSPEMMEQLAGAEYYVDEFNPDVQRFIGECRNYRKWCLENDRAITRDCWNQLWDIYSEGNYLMLFDEFDFADICNKYFFCVKA